MRSELYFIRRWHDHNTTRTDRAVARIRRMVVSQNWSSGEVAACGCRASDPGRKTGTRRRE